MASHAMGFGSQNERQSNNDGQLDTSDLQMGDKDAWTSTIMGSSGQFIGANGLEMTSLVSKGGENVGEWLAKRNAGARQGWAKARAAQNAGQYLATVAERNRQAAEQMTYDPAVGGWRSASPPKPAPAGNLNLRQGGGSPSGGNPFESRLFSNRGHHAVADTSSETYAYSGARGIFQAVDAQSYVPEHYRRHQQAKSDGDSPSKGMKAPGSDVTLKGGWPVDETYGKPMTSVDPTHVGGWSIEKTTAKRQDHRLFTHVSPSM